jgi:hypothetical protein
MNVAVGAQQFQQLINFCTALPNHSNRATPRPFTLPAQLAQNRPSWSWHNACGRKWLTSRSCFEMMKSNGIPLKHVTKGKRLNRLA